MNAQGKGAVHSYKNVSLKLKETSKPHLAEKVGLQWEIMPSALRKPEKEFLKALGFLVLFKKKKSCLFKSNFRFTAELRGRYRDFSYIPCLYTCLDSSIINIPHQFAAYATIDELTLTHHRYPKFVVYIMIHSGCCIIYGFGQICKDLCPSLEDTGYLHGLKIPLCSGYLFLLHTQPLVTTNLFIVSILLFFPGCHIIRIIHMAFTNWILFLSIMHWNFFYAFYGLIAHFFLELNSIPLPVCIIVCLSIHLLKDILVASKLWQLWIKPL